MELHKRPGHALALCLRACQQPEPPAGLLTFLLHIWMLRQHTHGCLHALLHNVLFHHAPL